MSDRQIRGRLQELGLTEYQSKAYLAAVKAGQARPSELVDESGVPQGRIYDVIDGLEELGLVEVRAGSRGKVVSAPSPQTVLEDLKRRRIDALTDTISVAASELEELHARADDDPEGYVSMLKREEAALRHARRAIDAAEYWLTVCVPHTRYTELKPELVEATKRDVTVRLLLIGTDPDEVGRSFPEGFQVRYRAAADTFVVADRTYGIFSSKHPRADRQPYIICQEPNLVLLFQNYGEQVWHSSKAIQTADSFPRRYLDPWRTIIGLGDRLAAGESLSATVTGRRAETREPGTWEGPIVDYDFGGPADVDYTSSPPTYASLTIRTADEGDVTVGGWKATFEDIAATGLEVRADLG